MTEDYVRSLDEELETQLSKISKMELGTDESVKAIKNLETLSSIRTDIYRAQQEAYEAELKAQLDEDKLELDKQKAEQDRKQSKMTSIQNWAIVGVSAIGSVGVPLWIMTAERRGQFFSNRALNASEKPPKLQFIRNHFKK